ncbi:MAG: hypothetical protein N3B21_17325 [Clostridia bacterium]|nr:hypothetical protein [Clostridia bacterium]
MLYVYIGCLAFGLLYSIGSALLSGHGFDHGGGDHGGHGGGDSADLPSLFNPLVIASAITAFGAAGTIGKLGFGMGELISSLLALTFSGIVGAGMFFGVVKLMYNSQSNSSFSQSDLIEMDAEVATPVPEGGMGEIVYVIGGVRHSMPAKSIYKEKIAKGEIAKIKEVSGGIAYIARKLTIDDLELLESEKGESRKSERNKNI